MLCCERPASHAQFAPSILLFQIVFRLHIARESFDKGYRDKLAWCDRVALFCVCMTSWSIWRFTAFGLASVLRLLCSRLCFPGLQTCAAWVANPCFSRARAYICCCFEFVASLVSCLSVLVSPASEREGSREKRRKDLQ